MNLTLLFLISSFLIPFSSLSHAAESSVTRVVLDNGLTVLIQELPSSESVAIYACVKTGSAMEGRSLGKGLSHFVEHMLFKGTSKRPVGSIAQEVKKLGGVINASTSYDYTLYTLDLPKGLFTDGLDIISDMLINSKFDAVEMEKERKVIHGEMALYNDRPDRMLSDAVFQNVYKQHPYRHLPIGYPNLFDSITHDELLAYYKERYIPNNTVLSIAGGIKADQVLPLIKQMFKDFTPRAYVERNLPQEPIQTFKRYAEKEYKTDLIRFSLAYQGVSVLDSDLYALDVLSMALGQGGSSRLYQEVYKRKHLVEDISASNYTPQDRGVFEILGSMTKDNLNELESTVKRMITEIQQKGLKPLELAKTKRQVLAGYVFGNQTAASLASRAAVDEAMTADPNFSSRYVEMVKQVTNEDIKRVARLYLQDSRLNVTVLKPFNPAKKASSLNAVERAQISKVMLDNKITLLLHEDHRVPLISIKLMVKGGLRLEEDRLSGLSNLTGSVWSKGTTHLTEEKIDEAMDLRGGSLSSGSSLNGMAINMDILSEDADFAFDLLEDLVKNPSFSPDAIERERQNMRTALIERSDDIMSFSSRVLMETLYLTHPMRKDPLGSKEGLERIKRDDLMALYRRLMVGENMVIAVFGDINEEKVKDILTRKFGSISKGKVALPLFKEPLPDQMRVKSLTMDKEQAVLMIAFQAPSLADHDRAGMEIINNYLGGGLGGKLFTKVREELGQAYTTSCHYGPDLETGTFVLYVLTTPEKVDSVKAIVIQELDKLRSVEISKEDLEAVKNYLKGSRVRGLATNSALASTVASDELLGLGYGNYQRFNNRIDAVTQADILRIAKQYLDVPRSAIVITKPKAGNQNHE